jgi:phosphoribosylanthranilate isomerase
VPVDVKICGLNDPAAVDAAVEGGARFAGFVFYPPSPRSLTPVQARELVRRVPAGVVKVGLFVDADDSVLASVLDRIALDELQFHGDESPERVLEVRAALRIPVMKAIKLASAEDLETARAYESIADRLMFDAKAPADLKGALPGGNALAFDWRLLHGHAWKLPWMLAGGLTADNIAEAVKLSGATALDVSSGVEDAPGVKSVAKIAAFLAAAAKL